MVVQDTVVLQLLLFGERVSLSINTPKREQPSSELSVEGLPRADDGFEVGTKR